ADGWMKDHGFYEHSQDLGFVEEVLNFQKQQVITSTPAAKVEEVITMMKKHGISQIPLLDDAGKPESIVHEVDILHAIRNGEAGESSPVGPLSKSPGGLIYPKARIEELFRIFETDQVALVVDANELVGVITKIDLIDFLTHRNATT